MREHKEIRTTWKSTKSSKKGEGEIEDKIKHNSGGRKNVELGEQ